MSGVLLSLEGKNALVTGGSGGIGSAVLRRLLEAGARAASVDLPGAPAPPPEALRLDADLARGEEVRRAVGEAAERFDGALHFLVHCAGITRDGLLWKMPEGDWEAVLRVNLNAAFHLLKAAVPLLRRAGSGSVVLVSSINGQRGKFGQANYSASKAGLDALARTAARELGRFRVRVNAVAPGFVETAMTRDLPAVVRKRAEEETALGRLGAPEEVADVALFLLSDLSRHVTGQVLRVDGGQLIA